MNPGPLCKAVVFSCFMAAFAAPQEQASAPQLAAQIQVPQPELPPAEATPAQAQPSHASHANPLALTPLPGSANEYVSQAIEHEVAEQTRDHSHWRYRYHREDEKSNLDRDVIGTSEGSLARTLLLWGKPLTAEQRQEDEQRMRKLVSDPAERARRSKREREDDEKVMKMLRAIPQAFIFKYDGEENGLVRLSFTPSPHYDPPSMELRVFRSLNGHLWIDRTQNRLAQIDGTLTEDVNFGWGILGRLYKGGTFKVVQNDVGGGHWEPVFEEVNMTGRAVLFKTITRKQKEVLTDFRKMPDFITMSQAFEMLQKDSNPASVSSAHAAPRPAGKN